MDWVHVRRDKGAAGDWYHAWFVSGMQNKYIFVMSDAEKREYIISTKHYNPYSGELARANTLSAAKLLWRML